MDLETNIRWAHNAINYVQRAVPLGASNLDHAAYGSEAARQRITACVDSVQGKGSTVDEIARLSDAANCGNCGEQSAVAFVYLRDRGVRPLDRVGRKLIDHAFVIIGRMGQSTLDDLTTWGSAAVICDPWALQMYGTMEMAVMPASEAPQRWKNKMGVRILDGRPVWFTVGEDGKLSWVHIGFNAADRVP